MLAIDGHRASSDPHRCTGAATGGQCDHTGRADEQVIAVTAVVGQDYRMQQPPLGAEVAEYVVVRSGFDLDAVVHMGEHEQVSAVVRRNCRHGFEKTFEVLPRDRRRSGVAARREFGTEPGRGRLQTTEVGGSAEMESPCDGLVRCTITEERLLDDRSRISSSRWSPNTLSASRTFRRRLYNRSDGVDPSHSGPRPNPFGSRSSRIRRPGSTSVESTGGTTPVSR